jgi:2-dehydropantoate 2-reductase
VGAGAVGCFFGGMLAKAGGAVTFIGRQRHVDAIRRDGLQLESALFVGRIPASASTEIEAIRGAGVVLLCVKTLDTEAAMKAALPFLASDTIVVSLQNGADNVDRIRSAVGIEAVPGVVYVAAEMIGPGRLKHNGRGDLILGNGGPNASGVQALSARFNRAGVPCRVSTNIAAELWTKLIMNCAYNAMSALCRSKYGKLAHNPLTREIMRQCVEEAVAVARASGVALDRASIVDAAFQLGVAMSNAMSSTAQDIARRKLTEIDSLNGYVVRRGAELGVPTPVNQTLYGLVKVLEEADRSAAAS